MNEYLDITEFKARLNKFAEERDWRQFHNPKNLAMATAVEASELLEIFQWLTPEESESLGSLNREDERKVAVANEVSDIVMYCLRLCDILNINLQEALEAKFIENQKKYPPEKCRGSAAKYSSYK